MFFVDGRTFDPNRTDTRVKLGAIEESKNGPSRTSQAATRLPQRRALR
jgi:hypothetical protein